MLTGLKFFTAYSTVNLIQIQIQIQIY